MVNELESENFLFDKIEDLIFELESSIEDIGTYFYEDSYLGLFDLLDKIENTLKLLRKDLTRYYKNMVAGNDA